MQSLQVSLMKDSILLADVNIYITISFTIGLIIGGVSVIAYLITHPTKLEKLIALIYKYAKLVIKSAEYKYIQYDIQGKVNDFTAELKKKVPNLNPIKVKLEWIDSTKSREEFIKDDKLVIRMHKSDNQVKNIINGTFSFVSYALLRKAKSYIAKYQKDSIDLFVSYKLLEKEKVELLDEFVQEYLKSGMEREKVADFYDKYYDIDKVGIFFPILLTELTFLGEKVFGKKRDNERIHKEVRDLVNLLYKYAHRKLDERMTTDFEREYCKFAIRIIGKKFTVKSSGERVYINHLKQICGSYETIYLLGGIENKDFINKVVKKCLEEIDFNVFKDYTFKAKIKDSEGNYFDVHDYLCVLRNNKLQLYHQN